MDNGKRPSLKIIREGPFLALAARTSCVDLISHTVCGRHGCSLQQGVNRIGFCPQGICGRLVDVLGHWAHGLVGSHKGTLIRGY